MLFDDLDCHWMAICKLLGDLVHLLVLFTRATLCQRRVRLPVRLSVTHRYCITRKPCFRKETARCRKCSFRSKFANNIPYKYKTSHASKVTLQSFKHAGTKHNLTPNQDSKSRDGVWSQWKSSEAISNHNVGFNCQGFDFRRHSI